MEATGLFETLIPIYQSTLTLTTEEPDALIFRKEENGNSRLFRNVDIYLSGYINQIIS
jgi:hypothetical protein